MSTLIFPSEFPDNQGGAPQSIYSIVTGLGNNPNFRIVVLCPNGSEMSTKAFPNNVLVCTTKLSVWTMSKKSLLGTLKTVINIYKVIKPFLKLKDDLWIITNQPVESALISLLPCRHLREIYINRGGDFKDKRSAASLITLQKLKRRKFEHTVAISKKQFDLLVNSGMPKEKVSLIPNGLPLPSKSYAYLPLSKDRLRISTMGFISNLKNQTEGVKLIKSLRDAGINATLNIYGTCTTEKEYQVKLLNLINNLELKPFINFCGYVSGEKLFEETDIVISFSYSEGFGRNLVEGMLRKKPIIAWRGAGGPVDITFNGKYGHLVDNNEASAYFDMVKTLLDNPDYNADNVERAYNYACNHFTVEIMVANYINLFETICK